MENSPKQTPILKLTLLTILSIGLGASVTYTWCKKQELKMLTEFGVGVELRDAERAQQELELMRQKRYSCAQEFLHMRARISPESLLASELDVATGSLSKAMFDLKKKRQAENDEFLKAFASSDFDCSK